MPIWQPLLNKEQIKVMEAQVNRSSEQVVNAQVAEAALPELEPCRQKCKPRWPSDSAYTRLALRLIINSSLLQPRCATQSGCCCRLILIHHLTKYPLSHGRSEPTVKFCLSARKPAKQQKINHLEFLPHKKPEVASVNVSHAQFLRA